MYGSIFWARVKPGRVKDVVALMDEWERTRGPKVQVRAGYTLHPNDRPNELIGVVAFADRASYEANANDPEQHAWYLRLRDLLEADPSWADGEYVSVLDH